MTDDFAAQRHPSISQQIHLPHQLEPFPPGPIIFHPSPIMPLFKPENVNTPVLSQFAFNGKIAAVARGAKGIVRGLAEAGADVAHILRHQRAGSRRDGRGGLLGHRPALSGPASGR